MAGLPSANLVPRSTRWIQGSYVSVHPVSCTNLGHPASSCSLPPSTGSPLLKQPPTLAAPRSYFSMPTRSTVINQPLHRSAGPAGFLQPPLSSARPHWHAATAPNSTPTAQTGRQTALEWLSAASRHATHIRGRDNTSWPPLSTTNGLSRRLCLPGKTIPRAVSLGPEGGPSAHLSGSLQARPNSHFTRIGHLSVSGLFGAEMYAIERRHFGLQK